MIRFLLLLTSLVATSHGLLCYSCNKNTVEGGTSADNVEQPNCSAKKACPSEITTCVSGNMMAKVGGAGIGVEYFKGCGLDILANCTAWENMMKGVFSASSVPGQIESCNIASCTGDLCNTWSKDEVKNYEEEEGEDEEKEEEKENEDEEEKKCEGRQVWNKCGSACNRTCENRTPECTKQCVPRCECPSTHVWHKDQCIQPTECPAENNGWTGIIRGAAIKHDLEKSSLEIKTDSTPGSGDQLAVMFFDAEGFLAGGVYVKFTSLPQYSLHWCTKDWINFEEALPDDVNKVWRITLHRDSAQLLIECNDKKVASVLLAGKTCTNEGWMQFWARDIEQITFLPEADTASDGYRSYQDKKCEGGQVWNDCGMDCLLTCDGFRPAICSKKCKPRCQCPTTAPVWHEDAGKCVTNDLCPAKECKEGRVWNKCGSSCPRTCEDRNPECTKECVPKCECPATHFWHKEICVKEDKCPEEEKEDPCKEDCNDYIIASGGTAAVNTLLITAAAYFCC